MKQQLILLIAYTYLMAQSSSVAQTAQPQPPEGFPGVVERAATTQPAIADGAQSPALTGTDLKLPMRERHPLYRLCQSDVVEITFSFAPEFDQTLTVQPDGFLPLKAVEQLQAAGRTVPELRESIRSLYAPLLHDPEVTVVLKTFEKPYFVATGQVTKPGKYDLLGATSVVEALAARHKADDELEESPGRPSTSTGRFDLRPTEFNLEIPAIFAGVQPGYVLEPDAILNRHA